MQADSVLTFNSASSLVEFVCEFLKYKCAAAIWFCAKHAHTHPHTRKAACYPYSATSIAEFVREDLSQTHLWAATT
jgi:hypothetical protein